MNAFEQAQKAQREAQRDLDDNQRQKREAALTPPGADPNKAATDRAKREGWSGSQRR